jgi:high-affinity iron transporter
MRAFGRRIACAAFFACALASHAAPASDPAMLVHLLDYISVDYAGAVADGKVKSADEFKEMNEFAAHVAEGVARLDANAQRDSLEASAAALVRLVASKAPAADVAAAASALKQSIVSAYGVAIGPSAVPDLKRAAVLYAEHCSGCHGTTGLGDGPLARGMDPAPANFHDGGRQSQRSVHGLYNTITLGVAGTAMRAFAELSTADRWALAYFAANLASPPEALVRGRLLWDEGHQRGQFTSQAAIAGPTSAQVRERSGDDAADVLAYLRSDPARLEAGRAQPLEHARAKIQQSMELYSRGQGRAAQEAALSAYLEGFELVEASLATVDEPLMRSIERLMIDYRNALKSELPLAEVRPLSRRIDTALSEAQARLAQSGLSPLASFTASFIILLREGLEALLVVVALAAFLRRGGQAHALPYLHLGWIGALVLGALTWLAAAHLIEVSGASREITEGVTGLIAAAMLLYVGFWLHDKSHARAWNEFVMAGAKAVQPGAAWGLALMAFLAVYREVFETILFYEALWIQAEGEAMPILAGLGAAVLALAAIGAAMLRYSVRLPLGLFFGASGILLAVLAVVLAGNGVASLQEAGWLPTTPVPFVTLTWLGIHPNAQSLGVQLVLAIAVVALLRMSSRKTLSIASQHRESRASQPTTPTSHRETPQ